MKNSGALVRRGVLVSNGGFVFFKKGTGEEWALLLEGGGTLLNAVRGK